MTANPEFGASKTPGGTTQTTALETCRICGSTSLAASYRVREMMFGTRSQFNYFQCKACGCLQISEIPTDLSFFYPAGYYSLDQDSRSHSSVRTIILRQFCRLVLCKGRPLSSIVYRALAKRLPSLALLALAGVTTRSRILDVGAGGGRFVSMLRRGGFSNALGLDPNLGHDILDAAGDVLVLKCDPTEHSGEYDIVLFDHSFEHVADPLRTLRAARCLLLNKPTSACVIQTPTVSSWAWHHYRENWVQLDCPRHLHLHSLDSIRQLAACSGFELQRVTFTSTEFQFWGSEQYSFGIPLMAAESHRQTGRVFEKVQMTLFRRQAKRLNAAELGDQAAFVLRTAPY